MKTNIPLDKWLISQGTTFRLKMTLLLEEERTHLLERAHVVASVTAHEDMTVLVVVLNGTNDVCLALWRHASKHLEGVCMKFVLDNNINM